MTSRRTITALALAPLLAGLLGLAWQLATHAGPLGRGALALLSLEALVIAFVWKFRADDHLPPAPLERAALAVCALTPLSTLAPWSLAPSHLGIGVGGVSFFAGWLTRYPRLGPFNPEVLLGTLCVLGASSMPVAFALYRLRAERPSRAVSAALWGLALLPWVPVVIRLDAGLVVASASGLPSMMAAEPVAASFLLVGPLMRAAAQGAMAAVVVRGETPRLGPQPPCAARGVRG